MKNSILNHSLFVKRRSELQDNLKKFKALGFDQSTFCSMPFLNIILEPDGSVGFCRHKGTQHRLGNLKEKSWKSIWNGPAVRKWRREFLEGKPQVCSNELVNRRCNLCPELSKLSPTKRSFYNEEMSRPLRLTANLNGLCNLKCQMCDVWQLPNGLYTELNFWSSARQEIFPYLEEVDLLSGEPMIQQDTYKLIDEITAVNKNCLWTITTNAHWGFDKRKSQYLDKIKIKNIILSVDSLKSDIYAKIRRPGKLSIVLNTIEKLISYDLDRKKRGLSSLNMNLNFLIQKDNWTEISSVISFCINRNIHPFITFCSLPHEHSLLDLDLKSRLKIIDYYLLNLRWDELTLIRRVTMPLIHSLPKIEQAKIITALQDKKISYESTSKI